MKKYVAFIVLATYAVVSNYCLVYAVVTGKPHMPSFLESNEEGAPTHAGCKGHASKTTENDSDETSHKHKSTDADETCCVSMLCDNPVVVPVLQVLPKPLFTYTLLPVSTLEILTDVQSPVCYRRDHDPPRLTSLQLFSSPRSPRAPPSFFQSL